MKHSLFRSAVLPIGVLMLLVAGAVVHTHFIRHPPEIESLSPPAAFPGKTLTIRGNDFGEQRDGSDVILAGVRVTSSHFEHWSDSEIRLLVPHGIKSGRVFVVTSHGRSNGALFTNKSHIPVVLSGPAEPGQPYIEEISPEKGAVGTLVTISGANFGGRRGNTRVFFRFLLAGTGTGTGSGRERDDSLEFVPCSELDYDYRTWSDQEIAVYVPDGAVSGNVMIETDRGRSNAVYFEVASPSGTKRFERRKGYQIQHDIRVSNLDEVEGSEGLELWVPRLTGGYTQQSIEESHDPEPMWEDYQGVMRYHIAATEPWVETVLSHTYWFDRYSISTDIVPESLPSEYDTDRNLYERYTSAGPYIPSDDQWHIDVARRVVGRNSSPYYMARAIYRYLIDRLEVDESASVTLREALESRTCPASDYGLLFVTLARAVGIPARPVAGYIVHGDKLTQRHIWAEYYLPHYGWVPVDPALGDGIGFISMPVENSGEFYFGNMDNQHITFSRHVVEIPKINPHSETKTVSPPFGLQTIWEEYPVGNDDYRSGWNDIRVIDWW